MSAMRNVIITNLLLCLLTTQQKVNSEVIFIDKAEDITYTEPENGNTSVWYTYNGAYFDRSDIIKPCADPSDGGIFTCMEENIDASQKNMNCKSQKIFVNTLTTGNNVMETEKMKRKTGQNATFTSQFNNSGSYILLWMSRRQKKCLFSVEVTQGLDDFSSSWNRLCCSTNDTNHEERIQLRYHSGFLDTQQHFDLDLFNLTSSDSDEYLNMRYTWASGKMKWKLLKRYLLNVTENENTTSIPGTPSPHIIAGFYYTIAGSVGGFIAVLAILLLSLFFVKQRGKHKKLTRSSPVGLQDDYECMPYAVSEQRKETNVIYSLAQNVVPTTDAEYSEVQLTNVALSGAHGSEAEANIVTDVEYAVITKRKEM